MHFGIDRTGLLGGLDIRDEGKGGRKDDIQVLESLNQRWCHLQRWARLGEKQVWGDEVGLSPLSHTQAWDKESSGVCQQSHRFVFVFISQVCVCFHWLFLLLRLCLVIPIRPNMVSITLLFFSY